MLVSPHARRARNTAVGTSFRRKGEGFGPDHVQIPRVGREDFMPRAIAPQPLPAVTNLLHRFSSSWSVAPDYGWPMTASLVLLTWPFRERYGSGLPCRVTRRWRPGGLSLDGDRLPEGATGSARALSEAHSCRPRLAASVL